MRFASVWLFLVAGCLKLTPTVIVAPDGATTGAASEACIACINAPDSPGYGCGEELATCSQNPSCERGYRCAVQDGCYAGAVSGLAACARQCAEVGGILGAQDPSTLSALALYQCILGKCHDRCFDAAGDAAAPPDVPPPVGDAGGACTSAADQAAAAAPTFASVARDCGLMCVGKGDATCAARCVEGRGISPPCARCWADAITCGAASCLLECIDPANPACSACAARNCDPAFHACAGL
jgi:hypothetical protein